MIKGIEEGMEERLQRDGYRDLFSGSGILPSWTGGRQVGRSP